MAEEKKIWDYLMGFIGNPYGVAGLMGNLNAESALNPKNLQRSFEVKLGMTDDEYTKAVDGGRYANFIHDGAGYGLAQWTYWSRKKRLLAFANTKGMSIGNLDLQLWFIESELSSYTAVMKVLRGAESVREASDKVCLSYERPADQSENALNKRATYGERYYAKYALSTGEKVTEGSVDDMTVLIGSARIDENGNAYGGKAGDQTGKEVSTQTWYKHSKGWRVFRAKDHAAALKIADAMQEACNNPHIGYDQWQRLTLYEEAQKHGFNIARVEKDVETDCSALVRVCCAYAGIMLKNFTTDTEPGVLLASGAFDELTDSKYTDKPDYLRAGDILDTATKGHTVVVLTDGKRAWDDEYTLRKGDKGDAVKVMQKMLMELGYALPKWGADGDFGGETLTALQAFQADYHLTVTGFYDLKTREAMQEAIRKDTAPTPAPAEPDRSYRVIVSGLMLIEAEGIRAMHPQAVIEKE